MSGWRSLSQAWRWSRRWRTELTFQVAMRMGVPSGRSEWAVRKGVDRHEYLRIYRAPAQGWADGAVYMLGSRRARSRKWRNPRKREMSGQGPIGARTKNNR